MAAAAARGSGLAEDGPADHEVAGAGGDGLARRQRPRLIVGPRRAGRRAARMPGVTSRKSGPQSARSRDASCGDATTPSSPASRASAASRSTCSATGAATPISAERRLVEAGQHRHADDQRPGHAAASPPRRRRRRSPPSSSSMPPEAWIVSIHAPSAAADRTAPLTGAGCRGTSGRGRRGRPAGELGEPIAGPSRVKRRLPILKPPTAPAAWSARRSASAGGRRRRGRRGARA